MRLLSLKSEVLDADFLANMLNQTNILVESTGVPQLTAPQLGSYKILYPNLNEQTKIGKLLNAFDNLIALHQRKLGEEAQLTMGQSPNSENYTKNPDDYILVQGNADMKNGRVVPRVWTTQITKKAEKSDLILSVRAPVGDIGKTDYDVVLGRGVAAIKGNEFIFQQLGKMKLTGYWTRYSTGSTFESINSNDIKDAKIMVPVEEEQQKIGSFFQQLDHLITLHQRKLTKLKELKQGYLQKLFPQNGSKFPQLRFAGFADAWEQRKSSAIFHTITDFVANGSFASLRENVSYSDKLDYAIVVRLTDYSNGYKGPFLYTSKSGYDFLKKSSLNPNDILISNVGANAGLVFKAPILDVPMTLGPNSILVRTSDQDREFMYQLMRSTTGEHLIKTQIGISAQPKFNKTEFKQIIFTIPKSQEEQQKIGNLFHELDHTIALHQRKLEKLQELKKGYLQKMFC